MFETSFLKLQDLPTLIKIYTLQIPYEKYITFWFPPQKSTAFYLKKYIHFNKNYYGT